jgi:hypothetical protein
LRLFDFLTVVDRSLIMFGVEYIRMKSAYLEGFEEHTVLIDMFIDDYFVKQWWTKRLIPMWNYNGGGVGGGRRRCEFLIFLS